MTITGLAKVACLGVSLIALSAGAALAATAAAPASAPAASGTAAPAAPSKIKRTAPVHKYTAPANWVDAASVAALGRMSAYLRTVPAFTVKVTTQQDSVDDFGQVVTVSGETDYKVRSPDAFDIDLTDQAKGRRYVYNGKSVTIYDPKTGYYASIAAPPTIRQALDAAADKYGITVPLDDLFHWDQGDTETSRLTAGHRIGDATINGQATDQYGFRQDGVDWQIWIAKGDKPLPLRVVIIASNDPAQPRFLGDLTWDTAPQFTADEFTFTPPPNAKSIPIMSASN